LQLKELAQHEFKENKNSMMMSLNAKNKAFDITQIFKERNQIKPNPEMAVMVQEETKQEIVPRKESLPIFQLGEN